MLISHFTSEQPKLMDMQSLDVRYILAARSWFILQKASLNPQKRLEGYLQCPDLVSRFCVLMEVVSQVWPEPFAIFRPCCGRVSVDEILFVQAIALARFETRPQFETLLCEMVPDESRNLLFARALALRQI